MSEKNPTGFGWTPAAVVGVYLVVGFLWILLSDRVVNSFFAEGEARDILQTYKGGFYVIITGLILLGLVRASVRRTKRIDEARIATLERYDELVENANDAIFTLDSDGKFTAVNRAVSSVTGYSANELLSMRFEQILADEHIDYITLLLDPQNTQNPISIREVKIKCKDGRTGFLEISSRPLSLKDDRASIENIARDVTLRHIMQAELEQAKLRYQRLIETANEGIWTVDANFSVTLVNKKICEITGFAEADVLGRDLSEMFDERLLERCSGDLSDELADSREHIDVEFTRPDGLKVWLLITSNPLVANGEFQGVLFMASDITERKNAENMLRESEERFRVLFDRSAVGGMIIGEGDRVIDCNQKACEMLGYTREELITMTLRDFDVGLTPDELTTLREDRFMSNRQVEFETKHRTKSGEIKNILVAGSGLIDKSELYTFSSFIDITDRKVAIEALQASEERLRKLYRIVADTELGSHGRIQKLLELGTDEFGVEAGLLLERNKEFYRVLNVYAKGECVAVGTEFDNSFKLYDESREADDLVAIEQLGNSDFREHPAHIRYAVEAYIGIPLQVSSVPFGALCFAGRQPRTTPFTSGDREFVKLMAQWIGAELTRDIAERALNASEEQLMQAQKLESVGRLAGGIAHDFNNMLTAINGYSDLILSKMEKGDTLRHNIKEIKKAGERSAALTQQLLAFSRKQILNPEILSINKAVSDVTALLERLIGEDIRLVVNLSPESETVEVDPSQLSQVIVNLAVNSRDAMPSGGTLTITVKKATLEHLLAAGMNGVQPTSYVHLSVSDSGVGMDEETRRQLFEPFFTTKGVGKGTGLGLATVYGFIKQSDGFITVDSSPGSGTTFNVYLPCVEPPEVSQIHITGGHESRSGAETILLVEDEEIVRKLGCDVLRSCGYTVIEASNGEDAIAICEDTETQIDLLLTDVVMPKMNGRELWEKLAASRPEMKVLFTSGYTDDMVVRTGIRNEETNFLQKPFTLDSLIEKVREVLDAEE